MEEKRQKKDCCNKCNDVVLKFERSGCTSAKKCLNRAKSTGFFLSLSVLVLITKKALPQQNCERSRKKKRQSTKDALGNPRYKMK